MSGDTHTACLCTAANLSVNQEHSKCFHVLKILAHVKFSSFVYLYIFFLWFSSVDVEAWLVLRDEVDAQRIWLIKDCLWDFMEGQRYVCVSFRVRFTKKMNSY